MSNNDPSDLSVKINGKTPAPEHHERVKSAILQAAREAVKQIPDVGAEARRFGRSFSLG